ncbi:MAG: hypothetical protein JXA66_02085 [Oligoflexia bacterium]|nr:hypothetical protein [Oligoflexia bacterium]
MRLFSEKDSLQEEKNDIKEFIPPKIVVGEKLSSYSKIKSSFMQNLTLRDKSFKLDDIVLEQMQVEEEEKKAFDAKVNAEVAKQVSAIREKAHAEAYGKGLAEGTSRGFEEKKTELEQIIQNFGNICEDLLKLRLKMFESNENMLTKLVYLVAEVIINKEIEADPALVKNTIKKVIEYSGTEEEIRIKLSPRDYRAVDDIKKEILSTFGKIKNIQLEPDENVSNGGCIVETNFGEINANLPIRLASMADTMNFDPETDKGTKESR